MSKKSKQSSMEKPLYIEVECSTEGCFATVRIDGHAKSGVCWRCVQRRVGPPPEPKQKKKSTRPRGWKFMKLFVDPDGTVYRQGRECPREKDTLEPTDVEKVKAEQKQKAKDKKAKKEARLLKNAVKRKAAKEKAKRRKEREIEKFN
jgi:hypothetical protein